MFVGRCLVVLIISMILVSCQAETIEYYPLFKSTSRLTDSYGICTHIGRGGIRYEFDTREHDLAMIDSAGATYIRVDWDWPNIRTGKLGEYRFGQYEEMYESINKYNKKVFAHFSIHNKYTDSELLDWSDYVTCSVKRFKDKIHYWEILNEADLAYKWTPGFNASDYVKLLKNGYVAIKQSDKRAQVLFSGLAFSDNLFIDSVFCHNVSKYFDIMTVHRYTDKKREPEEFLDYFSRLKTKLRKYKIDKPVWLTETGGSTMLGIINEKEQAIRVPRIYLISFACGIDKVFWYKSKSREMNPKNINDYYGLWHKDYSPKPAFYTYRTLTSMCPDKSTRPKLLRKGDVYIASWRRPDGKKIWALWTSNREEIINLDIKGTFKMFNDNGDEIQDVPDLKKKITPSVIYVVGAKNVSIIDE